jgi:hypothetical protein
MRTRQDISPSISSSNRTARTSQIRREELEIRRLQTAAGGRVDGILETADPRLAAREASSTRATQSSTRRITFDGRMNGGRCDCPIEVVVTVVLGRASGSSWMGAESGLLVNNDRVD